jgi:hypothetical protein
MYAYIPLQCDFAALGSIFSLLESALALGLALANEVLANVT